MERYLKKGGSRASQSNTATAANKKEIDARRLRKLKVYLKSVSYNSCEDLPKFPTLPDLYEDTILSEEFPCDTMKLRSRQHCAPTPFLIACCFNRCYPVNVRKRTRHIRSMPLTQQDTEKRNSLAEQKNILLTTNNIVSSGGETNKRNCEVSQSVVARKLLFNSSVEGEKAGKKHTSTRIVIRDQITKSGKNNDLESSKESFKSSSVDKITTENQKGKLNSEILPRKLKQEYSAEKKGDDSNNVSKAESCCGLNNCEEESMWKKGNVTCGGKTLAVDELKRNKVTMDKTEIMEKSKDNREEHLLCVEKAGCLATNKQCERNKAGKELAVTNELKSCVIKEASTATEKENNQGSSSETCSNSYDGSSCQQSFAQIEPKNSTFKNQKVVRKPDETTESCPKRDDASVNPSLENEKICTKQHHDKDDARMTNTSAGPSCHTSPRLVTLCHRHNKTVSAMQDKERIGQRKDAKCLEKMKCELKVSKSTNTRLRSRAVIKQPNHEKRYMKSNQKRAK